MVLLILGITPKWVRGEGRNGGVCIKFVDRNVPCIEMIVNGEKVQFHVIHRPPIISRQLSCNFKLWCNSGADLFYITYFQKL